MMNRVIAWLVPFIVLSSMGCTDEPWLECEKKWGEIQFYGKQMKRYRLRANDFPEGKRFRLVVKWSTGEEAETFSYVANRKGHLILETKDIKNDPLYAVCPLKKGERIEFVMRAEDDPSFFVTTSLIPFPNEMKTKSGLELSLELKGQEGESFIFHGKGFKAKEQFEVVFTFQGVEQRLEMVATEEGSVYVPFDVNLHDKEGLLTIRREREDVEFPIQTGASALGLAGGFCLEIQ